MRNDDAVGGRGGVGKQQVDEAEPDGGAEDLGGEKQRQRGRGDTGEGVGEDPADGDSRVGERRSSW